MIFSVADQLKISVTGKSPMSALKLAILPYNLFRSSELIF